MTLILAFLGAYAATIAAAIGIRVLAQRVAPSAEPRTVSSMAVLGSAVRAGHTRQPVRAATADEPRAYSGAARTTHATEDPAERSHPSAPASEASGSLTGGQPGHRRPRSDAPRHDPASLGRAVERWLS
jgi:hypothetical protein